MIVSQTLSQTYLRYENQAQTLTTGAEANLLKLRELLGTLTEDEQARWDDIKKTFGRNLLLGGEGSDKLAQLIAQMTQFNEGLGDIKAVLADGMTQMSAAAAEKASTPAPPAASEPVESKQLVAALRHLSSFNDNQSKIGESLSQMQANGNNASGPGLTTAPHEVKVFSFVIEFPEMLESAEPFEELWILDTGTENSDFRHVHTFERRDELIRDLV